MSATAPPDSATAVRLARFVYPELEPACIQVEEGFEQHAVWSEEIIHGEQAEGITLQVVFRIDSLDDIALAEQRVVAAGLGEEWVVILWRLLGKPTIAGSDWSGIVFLLTATAPQRARALLALLDAHPELEESK